jgi:hypothetical protein
MIEMRESLFGVDRTGVFTNAVEQGPRVGVPKEEA